MNEATVRRDSTGYDYKRKLLHKIGRITLTKIYRKSSEVLKGCKWSSYRKDCVSYSMPRG